MAKLNIAYLMALSYPILDQFLKVEPKRWSRETILLELVGELGTLAHYIQLWEGVKHGRSNLAELADECSDVLFIILRLARQDALSLPHEIDIVEDPGKSTTELVLELSVLLSSLTNQSSSSANKGTLIKMLQKLCELTNILGIDLVQAHQLEMKIASLSFKASGNQWPYPQLLRNPIPTLQLWRVKWQKKKV